MLSGRSLQCLSRHISGGAGLQLGVQLDIPASVVAGMTFDTLAGGHLSTDVTYRVLLLWKRRVAGCCRRTAERGDTRSTDAQVSRRYPPEYNIRKGDVTSHIYGHDTDRRRGTPDK